MPQITKTYEQAKKNLIKENRNSLGYELFDLDKTYSTCKHDLEKVLKDLSEAKKLYIIESQTSAEKSLPALKQGYIVPLRAVIKNALQTLPEKELSEIMLTNDEGQTVFLLNHLAELGELSLFHQAFKKLNKGLSDEHLVQLFDHLLFAYEGTLISQQSGLASIDLKRGDTCYIAMAELMINELHKQYKAGFILNQFFAAKGYSAENLPVYAPAYTYRPSKYIFINSIWAERSHTFFDKNKVIAEANREFDRFNDPEGTHLFWKLMHNYSKSPRILNEHPAHLKKEYPSYCSSFLLSLFQNKWALLGVGLLITLGVIALVVGNIAATGVIAAISSTPALILENSGILSTAIGSMFTWRRFSTASKAANNRPQPTMQEQLEEDEHVFRAGASVS